MDDTPATDSHAVEAPDSDSSIATCPPANLCRECQTVVDMKTSTVIDENYNHCKDEYYIFRHHKSWSALKISSLTGCCLCAQFVRYSYPIVDDIFHTELDTQTGRIYGTRHEGNEVMFLRVLYPYTRGDLEMAREQELEARCALKDLCWASEFRMVVATHQVEEYRHSNHRGSTLEAMPLCQRWFQQCCTSHEGCKPDKAYQSFIPTRLLDITRDRPRLCLAEEVTSVGLPVRYATLSHCWGTVAFATLSSANIDSFRQLIPPEALAKTFLDAIHIARALDFSYIWIDSLCIMQDSTEDWEHESGLMADVYGGSSLTIAASSAADGRDGCFFDRPKAWRCQVRRNDSLVLWNVFPFTLHDINGDKLSDRAWALQERYLSRRVLHFTRDQVFWECDGAPACETYPEGYPVEVYLDINGPWFAPGFALQKRPLTLKAWPDIVEDYSSRRLTKKSDRFPAIGGLAKLIQEQTKDKYITGMWMEDLEDQLTWYVETAEARTLASDAVAPYIAPSWSWASTTGHVDYPRKFDYPQKLAEGHPAWTMKGKLNVEVHAIHIQFASANPLGEIVGATLRLWCQNLYCGVVRIHGETLHPQPHPTLMSLHPQPHPTLMSFSVGDRVVIPQFWVFPDSLVASAKDPLVDTYILPIRHSMGLSTDCQGLVLQPTGRLRGQYRRIAAYGYMPLDLDLSAGLLGEENLVARDCVDHFSEVSTEDGVKRYIIDLV